MQNCEHLANFGAFVLLLTGLTIVIPYWRGKAELVSGWTFLLLGVAIFQGLGSFEAAMSPMRFRGLDWFNPTRSEVTWYIAANSVFLIALYAAYYYDPLSRKAARRWLVKWPPTTTPVMLYVIALCVALSLTILVPPLLNVIFFGKLFINVSHKGFLFATLFSFVLWYRNPKNLFWLAQFMVIFPLMCVLAMYAAPGRRLLLSVFLVPVCVLYYYQGRHWRPTKSMVVIAIGLVAVFVVNLMYSSIRRFDRGKEGQQRTTTAIIEQVKNIGNRNWFERFADDTLFSLSQQTAHYSMLTDHLVRTGVLEPRFLNTIQFVIAYPIPRRIWEDKPQSLGHVIVKDTGIVRTTSTNWGVGVAGHAAYEGGLVAAAVYAYMAAFGMRLLDDSLRRDPTNPFLIGILAAGSMHILAWPRGDMLNMTVETAEAFFFAVALGILGRMIYGTAPSSQPVRWTPQQYQLAQRAPAR